MMLPITVIIPVYNGAKYLAAAMYSVLAQTVQPLEILIIDDGSTDATASVAQGFAPPVRYAHQPNGGAAAARNRGLALAEGALIAFLDADDLWEPNKLARQWACFESDTVDLVFGQIRYFISHDTPPTVAATLHCPHVPQPGLLPSTLLARREAFTRVGLFDTNLRVGEFVSWCAHARDLGLKEIVLPDVVAARRLHGQNQGVLRREAREDFLHIVKAVRDRRKRGAL